MSTDAKAATIVFLKEELGLNRVYYDAESFESSVSGMPQDTVLLVRSGGPEELSYQDIHLERFDIKCFSKTAKMAWDLHTLVEQLLKQFTPRILLTPEGGVKVYNYIRSGGPNDLRDQDAQWPFVWTSWLVKSNSILVDIGMFSPMFSEMFS